MNEYLLNIDRAKNFLEGHLKSLQPSELGSVVTLGSGLGNFAESFEEKMSIPFNEIPHFKIPSVSGHSGEIYFVKLKNKVHLLQSGRLHFYEGHSYDEINFPLRVFKKLGFNNLIITNSAGSLNPNFNPGDLVVIKDHINLSGFNPLIGKNLGEIGPRFPDMTQVYNKELIEKIKNVSKELSIPLKDGVYFHVSGPSYETPSEVKLFHQMGGDMVGMSTVPEVIAAKHAGYNILGVSCITNYGSGIIDQPLTHDDVKKEALKVVDKFSKLIKEYLCLP